MCNSFDFLSCRRSTTVIYLHIVFFQDDSAVVVVALKSCLASNGRLQLNMGFRWQRPVHPTIHQTYSLSNFQADSVAVISWEPVFNLEFLCQALDVTMARFFYATTIKKQCPNLLCITTEGCRVPAFQGLEASPFPCPGLRVERPASSSSSSPFGCHTFS